VEILRRNKRTLSPGAALTAEATPHHIALTSADALAAGGETFGKVSPPLRGETSRRAVIEALRDGVIDVIATDHAPHTREDKLGGAAGFSGLETAFAVCNTTLVKENGFSLQKLFSLLSAAPARLLKLSGAGAVERGKNADIVVLDMDRETVFDGGQSASRGKNTLFAGRKYYGAVVLTMRAGRITRETNF
jgi:dihydroorotase